jgi:hypothetical protein
MDKRLVRKGIIPCGKDDIRRAARGMARRLSGRLAPLAEVAYNSARRDTEAMDLVKEAFVCVSIPIAAFAIAYLALDTIVHLFLR